MQMIKDADCDGNGTVEFDEFLRMMRRYSQSQRCKSPDAELREAFNVSHSLRLCVLSKFRIISHKLLIRRCF
ncbi:hypothetical protein AHF37_08090 [Paragonimus kellicotti]|nr:hypothetical protein AHF37_08090 [Paragonimus kellicotti]